VRNDVPLRFAFRLGWLAVLVIAVAANTTHLAASVPLLAVAACGWIVWATGERTPRARLGIVATAGAGAVLAVWTPTALGFVAVAGIAAGSTFELRRAAAIALAAPLALAAASAVHGWSTSLVAGGAAGTLAGLVGGVARRQAREREAAAARTHLARELHDVLAHTLAALSVQLEAADAVLEQGDIEKLRELLARSRHLVASSIDETAQALRALRDEPVAIAERLAELARSDDVTLRVEGTPRQLPADSGLALYRAAQEALTNARKHAPGARTEMSLAFTRAETVLRVANAAPSAPAPHAPGTGLGLQGMRERLELAGGRLDAGAVDGGFAVEAAVPA
jgi:signal transduction histidine kinase